MTRKRAQAKQQEFPPTPQRCPKCGSDELMLHGAIRNPIEQPLQNGEPVGEQVASGKRDIVWERFSCGRCGAQCERTDKRILELREEIERLEFQLAFVTGRLVPENRLPC
jgi:ribosomal protein S27AE